jgi:uncharacterized repeat protein (TIGR04138 family)
MLHTTFADDVRTLCAADDRYAPDAYFFVREALDYTVKSLNKPTDGPKRHVSGRELLDGIRAYALNEYGPLSLRVLHNWGVTRTEDFGEIVFHLVEAGRLGKTDSDTREDFAEGYDFEEAFAAPFRARAGAATRLRGDTGAPPTAPGGARTA